MRDTYRVHITNHALSHLEEIFQFIQTGSPQNAQLMVKRLLDAIDDLEFMPERFRMAGKSRKRGLVVHARVVRPFIVYYRIDETSQSVFILEVRHGARRQPKSFD